MHFIYLYTCYIIQNVQLLILASRHNVGSFLVAVIVCHLFTSRSEQLTNLVVVDRNLKKQNTPKLNYQTTANRLITGVRLWSSRWVTWGNPESQQGGSPSGSPGCLFVSEFVSRFKDPSAAAAQSRSRQSPRLAIKNIKSKLGGSDGCRQCSNSQVCMTHFPPLTNYIRTVAFRFAVAHYELWGRYTLPPSASWDSLMGPGLLHRHYNVCIRPRCRQM